MPDAQHSEYVAAGDEPKKRGIAKRDQEAMSFRHRDLISDSGRKSNAVSEAEAANHQPWSQVGLVQPAAPTVRVVGPRRTRARVRLALLRSLPFR
jgi:hypothetical protein